jgi:hypothetical protein
MSDTPRQRGGSFHLGFRQYGRVGLCLVERHLERGEEFTLLEGLD